MGGKTKFTGNENIALGYSEKFKEMESMFSLMDPNTGAPNPNCVYPRSVTRFSPSQELQHDADFSFCPYCATYHKPATSCPRCGAPLEKSK